MGRGGPGLRRRHRRGRERQRARAAPAPPSPSTAEGTAIGSVSGGCVEGAVYELCQQALADGETVLQRFGYSDEDAFAVGLTCGGVIDILVTPVTRRVTGPGGAARRAVGRRPGRAGGRRPVVRGPAELLGPALLVRADGSTGRTKAVSAGTPELDRRGRPRPGPCWTRAAPARVGTIELSADGSHCPGGLTLLVETQRAAAPHDRVRGDRLRGGAGPRGQVPRLPRHRVRRPAGLRHPGPLPRGRRARGRLAAPLPRGAPGRTAVRSCACSPTTPSSTSRC